MWSWPASGSRRGSWGQPGGSCVLRVGTASRALSPAVSLWLEGCLPYLRKNITSQFVCICAPMCMSISVQNILLKTAKGITCRKEAAGFCVVFADRAVSPSDGDWSYSAVKSTSVF